MIRCDDQQIAYNQAQRGVSAKPPAPPPKAAHLKVEYDEPEADQDSFETAAPSKAGAD